MDLPMMINEKPKSVNRSITSLYICLVHFSIITSWELQMVSCKDKLFSSFLSSFAKFSSFSSFKSATHFKCFRCNSSSLDLLQALLKALEESTSPQNKEVENIITMQKKLKLRKLNMVTCSKLRV